MRRMRWMLVGLALGAGHTAACGDTSNESEPGSGGNDAGAQDAAFLESQLKDACTVFCSMPGCYAEPEKCVGDCVEKNAPANEECAGELAAVMTCATGSTTCSDAGVVTDTTPCAAQLFGFEKCTACVARPDDECSACEAAACCEAKRAAFDAEGALDFSVCLESCEGETCETECTSSFPAAVQAVQAVIDCQELHCPGCGGSNGQPTGGGP